MKRVAILLDKDELARLDTQAARLFFTRAGLVAAILRQWIDDPGRAIHQDAGDVPAAQMERARYRESILTRWAAAKERGRRRRRDVDETLRGFLAELERFEGVKIARTTLYRWAEAYRKRGLAGLTDGRCRPAKGPSKAL